MREVWRTNPVRAIRLKNSRRINGARSVAGHAMIGDNVIPTKRSRMCRAVEISHSKRAALV